MTTLLRYCRQVLPKVCRKVVTRSLPHPTVLRLPVRFFSVALTEAPEETPAVDANADSPADSQIIEELRETARYGQTPSTKYTTDWKYEDCRDMLKQWKMSGEVSPEAVTLALRVLLRCKYEPSVLSQELQAIEKLVGSIGKTPLTDELSLQLLKANGLAGHVGRSISLLGLRKKRGYDPIKDEFQFAIQSIISASLENKKNRNIYASDASSSLDNPTRFLDAILLNMHQRDFALTSELSLRMLSTYASSPMGKAVHFHYKVKPTKNGPRLVWNQPAPYYKIPSQLKADQEIALPGNSERRTKLDFERSEKFTLAPALTFFESLLQGACGHDPMEPTLELYNIKIKICCFRGAMWRAMEILKTELPQAGLEANTLSYLRILEGLVRVGDIATMQVFFTEMNQRNVPLNRQVVATMVDGYLNTADVAGSITFVQDVFNQHSILPPYNTHLKILELALCSGNFYEAKRHIYFIQQLWKFQPNDYHEASLKKQVQLTVQHPKLKKKALRQMFRYFGYELEETDFLDDFRES
jgi:hypothetical protein